MIVLNRSVDITEAFNKATLPLSITSGTGGIKKMGIRYVLAGVEITLWYFDIDQKLYCDIFVI